MRGLHFLGKAARRAAILGDEPANFKLLDQRFVQRPGERPLHRNDVAVGDARRLTGRNALLGGQHPGVAPLRCDGGKGSQLFGPGGEEDIALRPGQLLGGLRRTGKHQ